MNFIKITSKGEIDERAFSLLGASSKRDDKTKIGYFGSGLKFSLAFMLRKEIKFRVFSGYREILFTTAEEIFREKSFKRILVNGKETSLTTDTASDWTHWSIIREIFSNAIDEGEASIKLLKNKKIEQLKPIEDFTTFYIECNEDFNEIIENWDLYFSENRSDISYQNDKNDKLFCGGEKLLVYRKGIRCHYDANSKSLFHYDLNNIEINESRTISSEWSFKYNLVGFFRKNDNPDVIHKILYNINKYWEKTLSWDNYSHIQFSDTWKSKIGDNYLIPYENAGFWEDDIKEMKSNYIILPNSLIEALKAQFGDSIKVIGDDAVNKGKGDKKILTELSKREQYLLDEAVDFLKKADYKIEFPIKVARFVRPEILGLAENETIFISDKCFTMGKREIINTIIEENQHLKTGHADETRAMQTDLINLFIGEMEQRLGIYL